MSNFLLTKRIKTELTKTIKKSLAFCEAFLKKILQYLRYIFKMHLNKISEFQADT